MRDVSGRPLPQSGPCVCWSALRQHLPNFSFLSLEFVSGPPPGGLSPPQWKNPRGPDILREGPWGPGGENLANANETRGAHGGGGGVCRQP